MNKNLLAIIPAVILAFASTQLMAAGGRDFDHKKIEPYVPDTSKFTPVCHKAKHPNIGKLPAGNPQPFLLWVPTAAVKAHRKHGDTVGEDIHQDDEEMYTCDDPGPPL